MCSQYIPVYSVPSILSDLVTEYILGTLETMENNAGHFWQKNVSYTLYTEVHV